VERADDDPVPHPVGVGGVCVRTVRDGLHQPDVRARGSVRPLGYWSFVSAGAPVLGVVAGGPLVEHIGWRAIFAVQAPLCLAGVVVASGSYRARIG
jgi:MFS family permease